MQKENAVFENLPLSWNARSGEKGELFVSPESILHERRRRQMIHIAHRSQHLNESNVSVADISR